MKQGTGLRWVGVCAVVGAFLLSGGDRVRAVSANLVISQVYGAGGNTGAVLKNDYIEIFNRGASSVSLAGMSVQYAATTGSSWSVTALPAVTLAPGQYFLVQESGGANGAALPTPDATGTLSMAAGAGKVALVAGTTALSGVCPSGVVDFVGYGATTNCFEGAGPTPTISATLAVFRAAQGCTDTDSNSADFATGAPAPRNTATALAPCGGGGDTAPTVTSTTPAANATGVAQNASIVVNFSESVTASASAFGISCVSGGARAFTQTASPASSFTLTPTSPLPAGTTCTVTVTAAQVTDTDLTDPPDAMASNYSFAFATVNIADTAPAVASTSPLNGASNVSATSAVTVTFTESVLASSSAFAVVCGGVPQGVTVSAGPATVYTITPTAPLPFSSTCVVTVTAALVSDTDANDPPDTMVSDVSFSFSTPPPGAGIVMINEVDADTPGVDMAEFIELYDGGAGFTPLDGLVVVLYDGLTTGTGNKAYAAFDLDGYTTNAQGYFTLGNPGVPGASITFAPGDFGLLGNGPDAVALYIGNASDFPVDTVATTTNLQDAIVYGTDDPTASGLLLLVNAGQKVANENGTGASQTTSNQRCPAGMGGFRNTSQYYPGAPTPNTANTCPAPRAPSAVVISQIYGGGGNSGATYQNDYVELYNRGALAVDLTGWTVQYASSTGSGWESNRQPIGGTIGAGEYYLIALASGGANGAALPAANVSGQINMSGTTGKVALVSSQTALVGGCPIFDPTIQDFVGYGNADCGEGGSTTASASNTTALFRKAGGATDTDRNGLDFDPAAAPNPRRTATIVELGPNVLATDPRTGFTNAPRDATIDVTFTEPVTTEPGWFSLTCTVTGLHASATFASSFGGRDQYITPNDSFVAGETCTVTVLATKIHDVDVDDAGPFDDTLPANYTWNFTVATGTEPPYPASVHLTFGNPSHAGADPANYLMEKPEFTLSYNRNEGRPNWVSWHLSDEWVGTLSRVDTFRPDPQVPADWYRVQSFDFASSGFDRGHMTPNADRDKETSSPINQATFLMSNMVAQAPGNNQGPWAALEAHLRTFVENGQGNEVYIVAGPWGAGGSGSNGGTTVTLADGHVLVPASTWKVALILPKAGGDDLSRVNCSTQTIAVIMPNVDGIRNDPWQNYLTTVDAVEALTGYDFFSNLPEPYQRCIEAGTNGVNPPLVKGDQAITFAAITDRTYGVAPFVVSATGGASGNPVTFSAAGACTSSGALGEVITVTGAGTCTVTASQAGSTIYNAAPDESRTFTVSKAAAVFAIAGYSGVYDGLAQGAVGSATGVNGEDLTSLLHLGTSFTDAPGGIAVWTFDGDANYAAASGSVAITIARATAAVAVTSPTIEAGTSTVTIDGTVWSPIAVPTGTVAVTLNGLTLQTAVTPAGQFSVVFPAAALRPAGSPYVVTADYGGDTNFEPAQVASTVTVTDTTAPVIDAHPAVTAEATSPAGAVVTYTAPSAHDIVDGDTVATCAPAAGSTFAIGTTTVTCTAIDAHGNVATPVTFTVTVGDTIAPVVTYTGNAGTYGVTGTVSIHCAATDSGSGVVSTTCADITGPAWQFAVGVNTFSATATDAAGNTGSGTTSFAVTVTFGDLQALVSQFSTNAGVASGLNAKLDAAAHAANANARAGQLGAFQNQVQAQTGKALTAAQTAVLLRLVQALY